MAKKSSTKKAVYCSECKFYTPHQRRRGYLYDINEKCTHPKNVKKVDTYLGPKYEPAWGPQRKNEKCNCVLWEQKLTEKEKEHKSGWLSFFRPSEDEGKLSLCDE